MSTGKWGIENVIDRDWSQTCCVCVFHILSWTLQMISRPANIRYRSLNGNHHESDQSEESSSKVGSFKTSFILRPIRGVIQYSRVFQDILHSSSFFFRRRVYIYLIRGYVRTPFFRQQAWKHHEQWFVELVTAYDLQNWLLLRSLHYGGCDRWGSGK